MTVIKDFVDVEINLSAISSIKAENFNLMLLLGAHTVFTENYKEYSEPSQLLDDGFRLDSNEYLAASRIFEYDNPVPKIYLGRRLVSELLIKTNVLKANYVYKTTIGTTVYTYTKPTIPTASDVAAGLVLAMAADPIVNVTDNLDGTYTIEPKVAGAPFICKVDNYQIFQTITTGQDIIDDVEAILAQVDDWFAIMETLRDQTEVLDLAEWCEGERKLFVTVSDDAAIIKDTVDEDITSIAALFRTEQYRFIALLYHASLVDFIDAAWLGEELRKPAGNSTWARKNLIGITPDKLTEEERNNALAKKCNIYELVGGIGVTSNGTVFDNKYIYIDVVRDLEFLKTDIEVNLFEFLVSTDKIPYTDAGIAMAEDRLKTRLNSAVRAGILSDNPAPTTSVPSIEEVAAQDKIDRILRNLNFQATLANAIHTIKIVGTVKY